MEKYSTGKNDIQSMSLFYLEIPNLSIGIKDIAV
jgi:hypothetical protein